MDYFKEDVKDFSIQVKRNGQHIVLETAPKKSEIDIHQLTMNIETKVVKFL